MLPSTPPNSKPLLNHVQSCLAGHNNNNYTYTLYSDTVMFSHAGKEIGTALFVSKKHGMAVRLL